MTVDHLAWLDLETTGSDEHADVILELGIVLTDTDLFTIGERSWVVYHENVSHLRGQADPTVQEMHDRNGLWRDCGNPDLADWQSEVVKDCERWLQGTTGSSKHVGLAGSGVAHFDLRFLRKQTPSLARRFTYWTLDVGVVRRSLTFAGRDDLIPTAGDSTTKTHRALDDARQHLAEFRCYADLLRGIGR